MNKTTSLSLLLITCVCMASLSLGVDTVTGSNQIDDGQQITLGRGSFVLTLPKTWEKKEPRSNILEAEFSAPAKNEDGESARVTMMAAGGGVEANIERWIAQFTQPDGGSTRDKTTIKEVEVDGIKVYMVDITGEFGERPRGPRGPMVNRPGYRMLSAIVESEGGGLYFIKMVGPATTVESNADAFGSMIESIDFK